MSGDFATSSSLGRTVVAVVLCLLALSFAMEAKLAWYGPAHGLGSDVREAKALPADIPQVIAHGVANADLPAPLIALSLLAAFTVACTPAVVLFKAAAVSRQVPSLRSDCFSPHNFLRPPPIR